MNLSLKCFLCKHNKMNRTARILRKCSHTNTTHQQKQQQNTNILLCPGQSSQHIGMLKPAHITTEKLNNMIGTANSILGFDIVDICENGPMTLLDRTVYCQPAVVLSSILAFEKLKEHTATLQEHTAVLKVGGVAGYSVGEVSALYMSGRLGFEDTITFVRERALAMDYASTLVPSGMCTLQGLPLHDVEQLCNDLTNEANDPRQRISVAIQQFPKAVTLGGSHLVLNRLLNRQHPLLRDENRGTGSMVKVEKVNVSGAFHTEYMKPAQDRVHEVLQKLTIESSDSNLSDTHSSASLNSKECLDSIDPVNSSGYSIVQNSLDSSSSPVDLYCNVTGTTYKSSHSIPELLVRQLCEPVLWSSVMDEIRERYLHRDDLKIYEVGPGKQLKAIASRIDRRFLRKTENVSV